MMTASGIAALALGGLVAALAGVFLGRRPDTTDPDMKWEGIVAVGFGFVVIGGPLWIAQFVCTLVATLGVGPAWLWAWWLGAPLVGAAVGRVVGSLRSKA
jgi:branched-subunit amino acid ABC-type transport system permease component